MAKTWIDISAPALRANFALARAFVAPARVIPVLKADAYGHGLSLVAEALAGTDAPFFAVDSLEEAFAVRAVAPARPVLVLGYLPADALLAAVAAGFSFVCSKAAMLVPLERAAVPPLPPARIHVELETGLYRQGADEAEQRALQAVILRLGERAILEGLSTHFANAEDPGAADGYQALQEARFFAAVQRFAAVGLAPPWRHLACSAAAWLRPRSRADAVRLGISLYGIWSAPAVREAVAATCPGFVLQPALTWKTIVAETKSVATGEPIGYGLTERVARPSRVAVLPVGYFDGFDRRLSSVGSVLVRGRHAKVLGRVCMNMATVDVTDIPGVAPEDEVVLFGCQGAAAISPEDWEAWAPGLIAYEALARLRAGIPRSLVEAP